MIIGLVSFHTCPKANLGEKDAGGMNVYLDNLAQSLDSIGHTVYVFTRKHDFEEDVEFKMERYKVEDENLKLDRWSLDTRLFYRK